MCKAPSISTIFDCHEDEINTIVAFLQWQKEADLNQQQEVTLD